MKKIQNLDLGVLFIITVTFWLIFGLTQLLLEKVGYSFQSLVYAFIAACAWLYLPRGKEK